MQVALYTKYVQTLWLIMRPLAERRAILRESVLFN